MAYGALDVSVKFNRSPLVKYSANAMGAGDAYARTVIGRQYMAIRAARDALAKGVDPKDLKKFVRETEENFRNEIFTKNKDGMWIVSDKAAAMAGDEAAMTTALEGSLKGFELIANWPGMRAFFPFVRTGFNYLDITFQHTPAGLLRNKYKEAEALDIILQLLSKQVEFWKWHKEKPLAPTDIQFQLCEFDKYERVRLGEGRPRAKYRREE